MEKRVVFLGLILVYLKGVNGLTCYITEIAPNSFNGPLNKTLKERNCNDDYKSPLPVAISLSGSESNRCFKIVGTDPRGYKVDIKGCTARGICDAIKNSRSNVTKLGATGYYLPLDAECYECEGDICNLASLTKGCSVFVMLFVISVLF